MLYDSGGNNMAFEVLVLALDRGLGGRVWTCEGPAGREEGAIPARAPVVVCVTRATETGRVREEEARMEWYVCVCVCVCLVVVIVVVVVIVIRGINWF